MTETEERWAKRRQEKRALMWGIRKSDGETVKIPYVIAKLIMEDLETMHKIRQMLHKLEQ